MALDVFAYLQLLIRTQRDHLQQHGHVANFQNMAKVWKANKSRLLRKASLHLHPDKAPSAAQITPACLTEASRDTACCSSPQPPSIWQFGNAALFAAIRQPRADRKDQFNTYFKSFTEATRDVAKWMLQ